VKAISKKYGIKSTVRVSHGGGTPSVYVNIWKGPIDFIGNANGLFPIRMLTKAGYSPAKDHDDVNVFHYKIHYTGKALDFITEIMKAANEGNHDNSDSQTDYFDVGWYVNIKIGRWDRPYVLTNNETQKQAA
jgi:hypothetical protein